MQENEKLILQSIEDNDFRLPGFRIMTYAFDPLLVMLIFQVQPIDMGPTPYTIYPTYDFKFLFVCLFVCLSARANLLNGER